MAYLNRSSLALFMACVLLGAGQAPAVAAEAKPGASAPAALDGGQPLKPHIDHELTGAEKVALAKRRLERCRLHPGTCQQGAKHAKDGKLKHELAGPSTAPEEANQ